MAGAKTILNHLAPPLLLFLVVRSFLAGAASSAGFEPWAAEVWVRWDSSLYLDIAANGYDFFSCSRLGGYPPDTWCGNAGWFPAYPSMISAAARIGSDPAAAGVAIAGLFQLATLVLLWIGFLDPKMAPKHLLVLVLAAFFPGSIYYAAVFPVSAFTFFSLLLAYFLAKQRPWSAGLSGAMAATFYSTGFLLVPATALWVLFTKGRDTWKAASTRIAATSGVTALGFVLVIGVQTIQTGRWDAFFKVQEKYGYSLHNPFATLAAAVAPIFEQRTSDAQWVPHLQTMFVALLVAGAFGFAWWSWKRLEPVEIFAVAATAMFWLFPLTMGGQVSLYRSESLLLPLVLVTRRLPTPVVGALAAASILLAWPMATLFFEGTLI